MIKYGLLPLCMKLYSADLPPTSISILRSCLQVSVSTCPLSGYLWYKFLLQLSSPPSTFFMCSCTTFAMIPKLCFNHTYCWHSNTLESIKMYELFIPNWNHLHTLMFPCSREWWYHPSRGPRWKPGYLLWSVLFSPFYPCMSKRLLSPLNSSS